jgi:hypothetical protein
LAASKKVLSEPWHKLSPDHRSRQCFTIQRRIGLTRCVGGTPVSRNSWISGTRTPSVIHIMNQSNKAELGSGLNDFADFLIQVGEGGFEGFAVLRVGGRFQVVHYSNPGELQVFTFLIPSQLLGRFGRRSRFLLLGFQQFNL